MQAIEIRRVEVETILPLRWERLVVGTGRATADFDGDRDPEARHYAALEGPSVVACASCMPREWQAEPAWQLRGMAVAAGRTGEGIGRQLLAYIERDLAGDRARPRAWCNARAPAVGFYARAGWTVVSEPFEIPGVGPHRVMVKLLAW